MSDRDDVLRYPFQTLKLALGGLIMLVITLPIIALAVWRLQRIVLGGEMPDTVDLIILLALATCGGLAWYGLGFALKRPVGLRIDGNGISGFAAPNLPWSDIKGVEVARFYRGEGVMVTLRDPDAFLSYQTGWARLRYVGLAKSGQLLVNTSHIAARASDIANVMENRLKASHS